MKESDFIEVGHEIRKDQNDKINAIFQDLKNKHDTYISKSALIRFAIDKFLEDVDEILDKHKLL
ncbi:MAG: hypothetical protein FWH29_00745 [Methanobrevibacter sp.]|nr:hypothetical protein [Methanobrevibacter sp.]